MFLGGCAAGNVRPSRPATSAVPDPAPLASALAAGDRAAFSARFAAGAGQKLAGLLWGNWSALEATLDASAAGMVVHWRAAGERSGTWDEVTVGLDGGLIASLAPSGTLTPAWLLEPLSVRTGVGASLVAATTAANGQGWLEAAQAAAAVVSAAELGAAAVQWSGNLVVELPSLADGFGRLSGLPVTLSATTGAATTMAAAGADPRIVVNPAATAPDDRRVLLVHEGVHAAMGSPNLSAPLWAVEGIAESVAAASDPATRVRNAALVGGGARPIALPTSEELNGTDAGRAYALASSAVDAAVARWGRAAVTGWLTHWNAAGRPSDADLTRVYLAALG